MPKKTFLDCKDFDAAITGGIEVTIEISDNTVGLSHYDDIKTEKDIDLDFEFDTWGTCVVCDKPLPLIVKDGTVQMSQEAKDHFRVIESGTGKILMDK